ncbi:hypothetical protein MRX96_051083 [Rhipicephalus microplus]
MEAKNAPDAALDDLPMYWDPQYNFYQDMMPTPTGTPGQETVSEAPTVEAVFPPDTPAVTPIFVGRDAEGHRSRPSSGNRVRWMPGILSPKHTKLTSTSESWTCLCPSLSSRCCCSVYSSPWLS